MSQTKLKPASNPLPQTFSVRVAGVPYKVSYAQWKDVDHDGKAERLFGQIQYVDHSIRIANDTPIEKQQLTLLHEVLHAIINEYNIRELQTQEGEHSEHAIDLLSIGIFDFLKSIDVTLPYYRG